MRHIFFAIIVDTFGKLRELKFERESEAKNTCFICGIERHDFDRIVSANAGNGFAHHKSFAHNPLNYLSFIMSVWNQSQSEDSSLEIYVRGCLENGDLAWFPTGVLQEAQLIEVEAHAEHESEHDKGHKSHHEEKKGHGGGHGHGHGHGGGHGHGHGHGHGKSGHQSHQKHVAERSHTDDAYQSEMIEKMNTMQKQLLKLSKSFGTTHASMSNPVEFGSPKIEYNRSPLKQSVGDLPDLHIAEDPVITTVSQTNTSTRRSSGMYDVNESIDRMNTTIERVMDRIDTMEKRLSKSHKYLRHRIRAQGDAVKSSQVASKTPTATILSRLQQVKKSVAENTGLTGPPVPSTPSPPFSDGSNDRRQQEELIKMTTPPKQTNNANYDSEPADKSNYESDSESSGSLCTAPSDSENAAVRKARPQSAKSPARATNRGSILLARPQSAQPPSVSRSPVHLSGPPQNLIPKGWN